MIASGIPRRALVAALLLTGCGAATPPAHDAAADLDANADAAAVVDAAIDAVGACVVGVPACAAMPGPDLALCGAAIALEPGAPRLAQDSAAGGFGECAASGSGLGGPSSYYRIVVPPGMVARVEATPSDPATPGLVRALVDCADTAATAAARGGGLTQGRAAVCLPNPDAAARAYVIAVSQYSGEADCLPLSFDVAIELRLPAAGCLEIE